MIEVRGLTKIYTRARGNGAKALDGVTFEGPDKSIFGFRGPNGAGKTATIRILATILEPTAGTATVEGHAVRSEPRAVKTSIGYMPEVPGYYPTMTADQHLDYWGAFYHMPRAERKARTEELLDLVGLGEERAKKVKAYSHGMLKRLGLAQALLHDPHVLILDEPAGGLDPYGIIFFRNLVKELNKQGKTIFLSSHILSEVEKTCDRVAIIDAGRIVVSGTPRELKNAAGGGHLLLTTPDQQRAASLLAGFPGVTGVETGERFAVFCREPAASLVPVIQLLRSEGIQITAAEQAQPALEDVFLRYTGSRPRPEGPVTGAVSGTFAAAHGKRRAS